MKITMKKDLQFHEAADIFPLMSDDEANDLMDDIKANGLKYAVELFEGKILDGRNRYLACLKLGIECETTDVTDDVDDPVSHVYTVNYFRRHLTEQQKAELRGRRYLKEKKSSTGRTDRKFWGGHDAHPKSTAERLGEEYKVNEATIRRDAKFVKALDTIEKVAGPEAKKAILSGECKLTKSQVIKAATLPHAKQKKAIAAGKLPNGSEGRPPVFRPASNAMEFALMAISQLERIDRKDKKRDEAFDKVINWIKKERSLA